MDWAVIMLQKEVALRLLAEPGTKEYGAPTVLMGGCATIAPLLTVRPGEFHPRPKVDSMVVKLTFHPAPDRLSLLPDYNRKLFKKVVNASFGQRRKTLLNALHSVFSTIDKQALTRIINRADIPETIRAERLSFEQFVHLTNSIGQYPESAEEKR